MARFMCAAVVAVVLVAVVAPVMAYNNVWSVCMWQCSLRARHLTPCLMLLSHVQGMGRTPQLGWNSYVILSYHLMMMMMMKRCDSVLTLLGL